MVVVVVQPPRIVGYAGLFGVVGGFVRPLGCERPVESFDLPIRLGLTGQSRLILWITSGRGGRELPGFAAGAVEAGGGFLVGGGLWGAGLVAADFGGDGFEAAAQLIDLDGETGQGGGVVAAGAVFLDDGAQLGVAVEGGPADAGAGGYFGERDGR